MAATIKGTIGRLMEANGWRFVMGLYPVILR